MHAEVANIYYDLTCRLRRWHLFYTFVAIPTHVVSGRPPFGWATLREQKPSSMNRQGEMPRAGGSIVTISFGAGRTCAYSFGAQMLKEERKSNTNDTLMQSDAMTIYSDILSCHTCLEAILTSRTVLVSTHCTMPVMPDKCKEVLSTWK